MKPRVVAFDLDDTLTVSKSKIDPRMAALLASLLTETDVCIISGGTAEQFHRQVLDFLDIDDALRARLHLMPTCGTITAIVRKNEPARSSGVKCLTYLRPYRERK